MAKPKYRVRDWVRTRNNGICQIWDIATSDDGSTQWFILTGALSGQLIAVPETAILEVRR